jgi:hypothetical protein
MSTETYPGPDGRPIDANRERELVRMALNDAWGFQYHAPAVRDWWGVFWESLERHREDRRITGQAALTGWSA